MKRRTFRRFSIVRRLLGLEAAPAVRRPTTRIAIAPSRRSGDGLAITSAAPLDEAGRLVKGAETGFVSGRLVEFPSIASALKASTWRLW